MNPASSPTQPQPAVAAAEMAPSPALFFQTVNAYQRSAAIRSALELDLFTAMAEGAQTAGAIAQRCDASPRGVRILCDYLTIAGFLTKENETYTPTHETFVFLNRRSPAYLGSALDFLLTGELQDAFARLTETVRGGTPAISTLAPENPLWVTFARSMAPMMALPADLIADLLEVRKAGPMRVLDVAAGHGLFGLAIARANPGAEITALDWAPVLQVARENASAAGVSNRYRTIAGDALEVDLGGQYDLVLLTNFLHHFDEQTLVPFLGKVRGALREGGRVAAFEFVPDENRVEPAMTAAFALNMLALTPAGDAYTFGDYKRMLTQALFRNIALHPLPPSIERVVTANR